MTVEDAVARIAEKLEYTTNNNYTCVLDFRVVVHHGGIREVNFSTSETWKNEKGVDKQLKRIL